MQYVYENKGVCSMQTIVDIGEDHVIENVNVIGGCNGNLKGIAALLVGVKAEDAIKRLEGITCGYKKTSCPDQIAQAFKEALNQ